MTTLICLVLALISDYPPSPPNFQIKVAPAPILSPKAADLKASLGSPMAIAPSPAAFVPPSGLFITNLTIQGANATIGWQQGTGPYQLEGTPDIGAAWSPVAGVGPTMLQNKTFPAGQNHFWRIRSQVDLLQISTNQPRLQWQAPEIPMADSLNPFTLQKRSDQPPIDQAISDDAGWTLISSTIASTARNYTDGTPVGNGLWYRLKQTTANGVVVPYLVKNLNPPTQPPGSVAWAKGFGGTSDDFVSSVVVDSSGFIYTVGIFQNTVDFTGAGGTVANGTTILTSAGGYDMFLAKHSSNGVLQWVKQYGGAESEVPRLIALDASGNFFISGSFATGSIRKINSSGVLQWTKGPITTGLKPVSFVDIATDTLGNVVCVGTFVAGFTDQTDFGDGHFLYSAFGSEDMFLAKYSPVGTCLWAIGFANFGDHELGKAVAIDRRINPSTGQPYNTIIVGGITSSGIDLGGGTMENGTTSGQSGFCGVLGKIQPDGTYNAGAGSWQRLTGYRDNGATSTDSSILQKIAIDSNGDIIVVTSWGGAAIHFGGLPGDAAGGTLSGGTYSINMALVKYNNAGRFVRVTPIPITQGGAQGTPVCLSVDLNNNIIFGGYYAKTLTFGTITLIAPHQEFANDYPDGFVAKYNSSLSPLWAITIGGTLGDAVNGLSVDSAGIPVIAGYFNKNVDGTTPSIGGIQMTNRGSLDAFIAKLNP